MQQVIIAKIESIEKCLNRIEEKISPNMFHDNNYDMQDIIVLNLQRACQQAIDLAMYISAEKAWGVSQNSREAFEKLLLNKVIDEKNCQSMKKMTAFRNIAVHQYQAINYDIVNSIIIEHLDDFRKFNKFLIDHFLSDI